MHFVLLPFVLCVFPFHSSEVRFCCKKIYLALVEAQDGEMTVAQSKVSIAGRFDIREKQVQQIEQEGIDNEW